jgi:hypothetical protein
LSDEAIELLVCYAHGGKDCGLSPFVVAEVRHAGGAIGKVKPDSSAYGNRDASLLLQLLGMAPTPESHRQLQQVAGELRQRLLPYLTGGVYLNFLSGEESQQRVESGYSPGAFQRLTALKADWDPDNRLHSGFNITKGN